MAKRPGLDNECEMWLFHAQCGQRLTKDALYLVGYKGWPLGRATRQWKKYGILRNRRAKSSDT